MPRILRLALFVAALMVSGTAFGEPTETGSPVPLGTLTLGASGGIGGGSPHLGLRGALATDFWAATQIGVGLHGVAYGQSDLFGGPRNRVLGFAPTLVGRLPIGRMSFRAALGVGRAQVDYQSSSGWILVGPTRVQHYVSWYFTGSVGPVWHLKRYFWLAGSVSGDVVVERSSPMQTQFLLTPNMVLGVNLL